MTESAAIIRVPGLDFYRDWVSVTQITISRTGSDWQVLVCKSHWQSWVLFSSALPCSAASIPAKFLV